MYKGILSGFSQGGTYPTNMTEQVMKSALSAYRISCRAGPCYLLLIKLASGTKLKPPETCLAKSEVKARRGKSSRTQCVKDAGTNNERSRIGQSTEPLVTAGN